MPSWDYDSNASVLFYSGISSKSISSVRYTRVYIYERIILLIFWSIQGHFSCVHCSQMAGKRATLVLLNLHLRVFSGRRDQWNDGVEGSSSRMCDWWLGLTEAAGENYLCRVFIGRKAKICRTILYKIHFIIHFGKVWKPYIFTNFGSLIYIITLKRIEDIITHVDVELKQITPYICPFLHVTNLVSFTWGGKKIWMLFRYFGCVLAIPWSFFFLHFLE